MPFWVCDRCINKLMGLEKANKARKLPARRWKLPKRWGRQQARKRTGLSVLKGNPNETATRAAKFAAINGKSSISQQKVSKLCAIRAAIIDRRNF